MSDDETKQPQKIKVIDPNGDIVVAARDRDKSPSKTTTWRRFKVSSQILRLASPVFNLLLDPLSPFREGSAMAQGELRELMLAEDDASPLEVIFYIIHLKGDSVPKTLPLSKLVEIAMLCDKYDMAPALMGWTRVWVGAIECVKKCIRAEEQEGPTECAYRGIENIQYLIITWAFKNADVFPLVTRLIVKNIKHKIDEQTNAVTLVDKFDNPLDIEGVPQGLLDSFDNLLKSHHDELRAQTQLPLERFINAEAYICTKPPGEDLACDRIQLGTLIRHLHSIGFTTPLDGKPQPLDSRKHTLSEIIDAIDQDENKAIYLPAGQGHVECSPFPELEKNFKACFDRLNGLYIEEI